MPGDEFSHSDIPVAAASAPHLTIGISDASSEAREVSCRRVVTLVGSREGCKIVLRHKKVAPVHLAIVNDGTKITALDLITKHGALLNGLALRRETLSDGDLLTIQQWELKVHLQTPEPAGGADAHPFPLDESPTIALEHAGTGRLLHPKQALCVIGRRPGCDIVLSDAQVSRVHALLFYYFGRPALLDLISSNHTLVNDEVVGFRLLQDEDVIRMGEERFTVRLGRRREGSKPRASEPQEGQEAEGKTSEVVELKPSEGESSEDLIDIHATESSQRWRIADKLEDVSRKRSAAS